MPATRNSASSSSAATNRAIGALRTPSDLPSEATSEIAESVNRLVADSFALYVKTKNFHWHISGPSFRDYHLLLDEQGAQIYASIDPLAERVRKLGQTTLRSIDHIARLARVKDNDAEFVTPIEMLSELLEDNKAFARAMREAHALCDGKGDRGTAALLETLIDETEKRVWFLFEAARMADRTGH